METPRRMIDFGYDSETYLTIPGLVAPKLVVGQVADARGERLLTPTECRAFFLDAWEKETKIALANAPFDLIVACAMYPELIKIVFGMLERGQIIDVLVRQALLDLGRGSFLVAANGAPLETYSLSTVNEKVLGFQLAKENTPRLTYAHRDGVPFDLWTPEERDYAKKDARAPYDIAVRQEARDPWMEAANDQSMDYGLENLKLEIRENRANFCLQLMSSWGIRTDPLMVEDVTRQVTTEHEAAVVQFTEAGIYRGEGWCRRKKQCEGTQPHKFDLTKCWKPWLPSDVGTGDSKWLQHLVSDTYQGDPPQTEGGRVSTDRDTLLESGDDLLMAYADAGTNKKEHSTYLSVIARGTRVPINVHYDLIKKTLRKSAYDPNLQNLPRGGRSRECFIARLGHVLCSVDQPSLELVTLAQNHLWMFGHSALAEILRSKKDPHVMLASNLLGILYEEGYAKYKAKDPRMKLLRQAAKPVNYGLGGGMGFEKLVIHARQPGNGGVRFCIVDGAERCGIEKYFAKKLGRPLCTRCAEIAAEFRNAWHRMIPEMKDYFDFVSAETETPDDALIECWGPEGEPTLYVRGRYFSQAANLRFQGLAARMMKDALWRVSKSCYVEEDSPLYGCRPNLDVHDELIVEMPEDLSHAAAIEQARLMTEAARYWCPDVPCEPEPAIMRRWFKSAEKVIGKDGRIVPWWPETWDWPHDQEQMKRDRARCI